MSSSQCSNTNDIIADAGGKYRFFNQPLEQIPGFVIDKPQLLAHAPNGGLMWFTIDQCMPVVTCLSLGEEELTIQRRNIVVIKDFAIENDTGCPAIPLATCSTATSSSSSSSL